LPPFAASRIWLIMSILSLYLIASSFTQKGDYWYKYPLNGTL
jgi:hypothetical protein